MRTSQNRSTQGAAKSLGLSAGASPIIGALAVIVFLLDIAAISFFWFYGATIDTGDQYSKTPAKKDLTSFPYRYSAAWQYPPVIYDFAEVSDSSAGNGDFTEKYTWLRMNYLAQANPPEFHSNNPAVGAPSIIHLQDTTTVRTDLMQLLQGKQHNDPQVVQVLSKRIVKLDNGWIAEVDVPAKSLNFYLPESSNIKASNSNTSGIEVSIAPLLNSDAKPVIVKSLNNYLSDNEYPLTLATGKSAPMLVACSRGTLLKLSESGHLIEKTKITGEISTTAESKEGRFVKKTAPDDFWEPIGGVFLGKHLVGVDTVLLIRRMMVIVLLATPLFAYLSFAWAIDRSKRHDKYG